MPTIWKDSIFKTKFYHLKYFLNTNPYKNSTIKTTAVYVEFLNL